MQIKYSLCVYSHRPLRRWIAKYENYDLICDILFLFGCVLVSGIYGGVCNENCVNRVCWLIYVFNSFVLLLPSMNVCVCNKKNK